MAPARLDFVKFRLLVLLSRAGAPARIRGPWGVLRGPFADSELSSLNFLYQNAIHNLPFALFTVAGRGEQPRLARCSPFRVSSVPASSRERARRAARSAQQRTYFGYFELELEN